jgi:hypothetical protein
MANLLQETLMELEANQKTIADVKWVGTTKYYFTWEEFCGLADIEYYEGHGAQEVASDLIIVGNDWWLERREYDGAESWDFKSMPRKPENKIQPLCLTIDQYNDRFRPNDTKLGWETLAKLNNLVE